MSASRQRLRTPCGMLLSVSDSVTAARDVPGFPAHVLVRIATLLRELMERLGFIERRPVVALEILHQRQLHDFADQPLR